VVVLALPRAEKRWRINGVEINLEVADSPEERVKGLSGRDSLGENEGMVFVFEQPGIYPFWMRQMKFELDFLWVRDCRVVELTEKVPPTAWQSGRAGPTRVSPSQPVDMVIEVNGGFVERHGVELGDKIEKC